MAMNPEMIARFLAAACGDPTSGGVDEAVQMVGERPELATGNLFGASVMGEADALAREHPQCVEVLLAHGADVNHKSGRNGETPLGALVDRDYRPAGLDGGTALHQAAWFGAPEAARILIRRGASLDTRCHEHDSTPLGWVAHGSLNSGGAAQRADAYARIAEMLLEAGAPLADPADPDGDPHGRWLLCDASDAVAEVLMRHGAHR